MQRNASPVFIVLGFGLLGFAFAVVCDRALDRSPSWLGADGPPAFAVGCMLVGAAAAFGARWRRVKVVSL